MRGVFEVATIYATSIIIRRCHEEGEERENAKENNGTPSGGASSLNEIGDVEESNETDEDKRTEARLIALLTSQGDVRRTQDHLHEAKEMLRKLNGGGEEGGGWGRKGREGEGED